jgi:hypothetical protein
MVKKFSNREKLEFFFLPISVVGFFGLMQYLHWPVLRTWNIKGVLDFGDLNSVLGSADCYRLIGFRIYEYPLGHECAYNYGSWLMKTIQLLNLWESYTSVIGWFFLILMSLFISLLVIKVSKRFDLRLLTLLMFVSPPVMLLVERGNLDILIFILVLVGSYAASCQKNTLGLAVIVLSFLYKFYTLGLVVIHLLRLRSKTKKVVWFAILGLATWQVFLDLGRGPGLINIQWASFGSPVFGIYLGYLGIQIPYTFSMILGWFLLGLAVFVFTSEKTPLKRVLNSCKELQFENKGIYFIFISLIIIHTFCYLFGMNFDYRLIFMATANVLLISQSQLSKRLSQILGVWTVLIMWLSFNVVLLQPIGDLLIGFMTALYLFFILWHAQREYESLFKVSWISLLHRKSHQ